MAANQDILRICEELLATLSAAETHLRVYTALQTDFSFAAGVYRGATEQTRELLRRAGTTAPSFVEFGEISEDTDELLSRTVRADLQREGAAEAGQPPVGQGTGNAPAVPIDDGPEGSADDTAPLVTDEQSVEVHETPERVVLDQSGLVIDESGAEESEAAPADAASDRSTLAGEEVDTQPLGLEEPPAGAAAEEAPAEEAAEDEEPAEAAAAEEAAAEAAADEEAADEEEPAEEPAAEEEPAEQTAADEAPAEEEPSEEEPAEEAADEEEPAEEAADEEEPAEAAVSDAEVQAALEAEAAAQAALEAEAAAQAEAEREPPLVAQEEQQVVEEDTEIHELDPDDLIEVTEAPEDASGDVVVMEDEDEGAATDLMDLAQARARAAKAAAAEDAAEEITSPDDEKTVVVDSSELAQSFEMVGDDEAVDTDVEEEATAPGRPTPKVKPKVKAEGERRKKDASAKFYAASASIPTIRDESTQRPRAAAVKIGEGGKPSQVLGDEEEDEPIAVGGVEDEDLLDMDSSSGLTLDVEDVWEEGEWDDEDDEVMELGADDIEMVDEPPPPSELESLTEQQIEDLLERAQRAAQQGNIEAGVNFYSDVLDADPDRAEAYIGRGRLHLDVGDYARAMSDFTVAEEIEPESPEPQVAVGDLYFARKDYQKAIEYFDAALDMNPEYAMAWCRRGISHYYRRNYGQALDDLNEAVKLDPEIPNIKTFVSMAKKKAKRR